jgi:hypothetical protein
MNPGQIITVPCGVIEGDRPISLHWTFNGNPITPRMGVTVVNLGERSVILSMSSVQAAHAGVYTCTAKNLAGIDRLSAELVVKGTLSCFIFLALCCHYVVRNQLPHIRGLITA